MAALACAALMAWLQFSFFEGLMEGDSYFHARAAEQLTSHGIDTRFPQAAYSTWRDSYSDKDFLFHLALIPFCGSEKRLVSGGKIAVVVFNAALFMVLAVAMVRLGIRCVPLWLALLLSAHPWIWFHLSALRPHLLALLLVSLELFFLLRRRPLALGLTTACHVLAHSSFVLVPCFVLARSVAQRLHREPVLWDCWEAVLAGIAGATLLHPYFPHNVSVAADQIIWVAGSVWLPKSGLPPDLFGGELQPLSFAEFLRASPGWAPGVVGLAALLASPRRRPSSSTTSLALTTAGLLALSFGSFRFVVFALLASAMFAGSAWSELAGDRSWRRLWRARDHRTAAVLLFFAACLIFGQTRANPMWVGNVLSKQRMPGVYARAIAALDERAAPEDQVYHNFWWEFAWLYHFRPEGRYIEGLDPIFLYRFDPERFDGMLQAYRGRAQDLYGVIAGQFDARWVFVPKLPRTRRFRASLLREPRIRRVYSDRFAEIYQVPPQPHGQR